MAEFMPSAVHGHRRNISGELITDLQIDYEDVESSEDELVEYETVETMIIESPKTRRRETPVAIPQVIQSDDFERLSVLGVSL
jgi:hypothetical protein